ncbi:MAG: NUDIX hydrolase [Lentimicrobiaceae bacterium]|nr:NUDIX hydrolase [Lentimicrobiaceae bacterium]
MENTSSEIIQQSTADSKQTKLKYCYQYPHPALAADCVIFGFYNNDLKILLIQRGQDPHKGKWAFPGGFMNIDETAEQCARRELEEETGLKDVDVEQFYTLSDVNRDPRERVLSVAHYAIIKISDVKGGDDAVKAKWYSLDEIPSLAFDHEFMFQKAIQIIKEKIISKSKDLDKIMLYFNNTEKEIIYKIFLNLK